MSLADLYDEVYGEDDLDKIAEELDLTDQEVDELLKEAEAEELLEDLSDEELDELAEEIAGEDETEKLAEEFDALGRFMAQGYLDELDKEAKVSVKGAWKGLRRFAGAPKREYKQIAGKMRSELAAQGIKGKELKHLVKMQLKQQRGSTIRELASRLPGHTALAGGVAGAGVGAGAAYGLSRRRRR